MSDHEKHYQHDLFNPHPAWCYCEVCGGGNGGEAKPGQSLSGLIETTNANEVGDDWLIEETVAYVKKQILLMTATVRKANRTMAINRTTGGANRPRNGLPYLNNTDLTTEKQVAKIVIATLPEGENKFQNKVMLKLEFSGGKRRLWGLKEKNPCFDTLCDTLGEEETAWAGREILIWLEEDEVTEAKFARCEVLPLKKPTDESKTKKAAA